MTDTLRALRLRQLLCQLRH